MKTILITKPYDARKLGVPVGSFINYDDAPDYLKKRHDDLHASKPSQECIKRNAAAHITALKIREGVARVHGTHAIAYSDNDRIVLNLIQANDFNGRKALMA